MQDEPKHIPGDIWEARWKDAGQKEKITRLGRLMFRAKIKALRKALSGTEVQSVLDVGSGLGYILGFLQREGFDVLGIDTSPSAIEYCRSKGLNAILKKLEEIGERYDLVVSDGLLEHLLNFEPYAQKMMKISRKSIILIQPNHESFRGNTLAFLAELFRSGINVYEYNYRIRDFVVVFEKNGFKLRRNLPVFGNVFRLLLFERIDKE